MRLIGPEIACQSAEGQSMTPVDQTPHMDLEARAEETAAILALLANSRRLLILCKLMQAGERAVGALAQDVGLSQSALSQHLALLRAEGIVGTRREAQTIHYRVTDERVTNLLGALESIFCAPGDDAAETPRPKRGATP